MRACHFKEKCHSAFRIKKRSALEKDSGFKKLYFFSFLFVAITYGCERDPTVTSWRLDYDNGWWARGIYRSDLKRISYSSFHWSEGVDDSGGGEEYGIIVEGKYFSINTLDPEMLLANGFRDATAPGVRKGHELWSGSFSNGGANLLYNIDGNYLSRIDLTFYQQYPENNEKSEGERFSFDAGQGQFISGTVSEESAAKIFSRTYTRKKERYSEW